MKISTNITMFGNCKQAVEFYREVFKADLVSYSSFKDCSDFNNLDMDDEKSNYVFRAELEIAGDKNKFYLVMGDSPSLIFQNSKDENPNNRDNLTFNISCNQEDLAYDLYDKLLEGGKRNTGMEKRMEDGSISGSLIDKFGICWIISKS